jgi:hypothetical protein
VKLARQVTAAYRDGVLRITVPAGRRVLGSSGAVEVAVALPAGSRVEARTASAQFTTEGPLGGVTFDSAQATVTVAEAATARVSVTVGAAAGVSAALDAGTTMGRLRNSLANAGPPALTVRATTTVGDITASSL